MRPVAAVVLPMFTNKWSAAQYCMDQTGERGETWVYPLIVLTSEGGWVKDRGLSSFGTVSVINSIFGDLSHNFLVIVFMTHDHHCVSH